jgi:uncharacterized membrane protein
MVNPLDLRAALLAKHAQHVVLIHFPIALFITAVLFDLVAPWSKRRGMADAAYYNLVIAAISKVPVIATGILRVAVSTRGPETKGNSITAPGIGMRLERSDLAGLVGAPACEATGRSLAQPLSS